ncbi:MAG: manganese-dependent inorganic pyrophosphatase [Firmicutes bacterium]|nr:manganese-dependent inorganic pyrophosphatase [Bacillota bacterium]MCL2771033.1 manganese-dependent inorganic pyrophosphatase [Bacillota bacterium]
MSSVIHVFGHKNPDLDTVVSSIFFSEFLNKMGHTAKPFILGKVNKETEYILNKFNLETPEILGIVADKTVAIVDTTDPNQLPEDIARANVMFIVDHHQLGGLKTKGPVDANIMPYGSTATILYANAKEEHMSKNLLGALMAAILSDTVNLTGPTTTEEDEKTVEKLSKKLKINRQELWQEILEKKADISDISDKELIERDRKDYVFGGKTKVVTGQVEVASLCAAEKRYDSIKKEMAKIIKEEKKDGIVFLITDLVKNGSMFIYLGNDSSKIEKEYGIKLANDMAWVEGMVSRKKQVIPPLETIYN